MDTNVTIILPILLPLGTAFILPIIERIAHRLRAAVCIGAMIVSLVALLSMAGPIFNGATFVYWMGGWTPREGLAIGISLSVDAWSLFIALVVAFIGLMSLIYMPVYLRNESGREPFYVLTMLLLAALIGFCLSGDLFNQFVWLEVFSVASFALTGFHFESRGSVEAAFKYLVTNSIAAFFIVLGLTLLYMQTGALNLAHVARDFRATPAGLVAIGLLIGGYATKAALIPWHFWLPDAHQVAPTPISAIFSATLLKVGIYAVARSIFTIMPLAQGGPIQLVLITIAIFNMIVGGIQMVQQQSMKRLLAYSSVSQMGFVLMGLALNTPLGIAAAVLHIATHALAKSVLFLGTGMVTWRTGIHEIREGGGLARTMPVTFFLMSVGAMSLSGLPLLSGFVSKTLLEEAAAETGYGLLAVIAIISSILTFIGLARLIWGLFLHRPEGREQLEVREAPFQALLPIIVLGTLSLLIGLFPSWMVEHISTPTASALLNRNNYIAEVMTDQTATIPLEEAHHPIHVPHPFDLTHWGIPALVAIVGVAGLYLQVQRRFLQRQAWLQPFRWLIRQIRAWHTGLINDYTLWNAFGTALILILLLLAVRFGLI
ncbi:MAG: proton-conducting transporter membrane subunit [Anaerolineae bacterium]